MLTAGEMQVKRDRRIALRGNDLQITGEGLGWVRWGGVGWGGVEWTEKESKRKTERSSWKELSQLRKALMSFFSL